MKFILLSDLHLDLPGKEDAQVAPQRLIEALDQLAQGHGDAEFFAIVGDLTDAGDPESYEWLRQQLHRLPVRSRLLIGNHDDRSSFLQVFAGLGHDAGGFVQSRMTASGADFLFLDTNLPGSDSGTLCRQRLAWLEAQIEAAGDRPVYLFMHHPPADIGDPVLDPIRLDNPDQLARVVAGRPNIRHIFFGHIHRTFYTAWNGIPCTSLARFVRGSDDDTGRRGNCAIVEVDDDRLTLTVVDVPV